MSEDKSSSTTHSIFHSRREPSRSALAPQGPNSDIAHSDALYWGPEHPEAQALRAATIAEYNII